MWYLHGKPDLTSALFFDHMNGLCCFLKLPELVWSYMLQLHHIWQFQDIRLNKAYRNGFHRQPRCGIISEITCCELDLEPKTCCTWMNLKKRRWFNRSSQYFYWVFLDYLMVESSVLVSYCALQWPIMDRAWVGWAGRYSGLMNSAGWQRAATYLFIYFVNCGFSFGWLHWFKTQ